MSEDRKDLVAPASGGRLDHVVAGELHQLSRSRVQKLIRDGLVTVNDIIITKNGHRLNGGEVISVRVPHDQPSTLTAEDIPLDVIYEDARVLVINKAAGMVVHPAAGHDSGTLVHAVLAHAPDLPGVGGEHRPGVVHRLDKDTSGLIILAKDDEALQLLQAQFKQRTVKKVYRALVDGAPPTPSGRVETPIGRDPRERKRMAVVGESRGRKAVTIYHTEERFRNHTLLRVQIQTGRTHQIRVHMAFLGCPVAGDHIYGRRTPTIALDRQFLHAAMLTLTLPGQAEPRTFEAPLPPELTTILTTLRRKS